MLVACVHAKMLQSYPTLCNLMDCSLPGSSAHGFPRQDYWSECHVLLQGIFLTQGSMEAKSLMPSFGRWVLYHQRHLGSPIMLVI